MLLWWVLPEVAAGAAALGLFAATALIPAAPGGQGRGSSWRRKGRPLPVAPAQAVLQRWQRKRRLWRGCLRCERGLLRQLGALEAAARLGRKQACLGEMAGVQER